ncbi:hypothetical protein CVT25_012829 [Psilocybe cyanescens]|uniref:Uncharacterized protein n=1 Tax=Psilocybe cyanescens TaxID=93625 RepID=A0A409XFB0_PSICY|nr:hypothetical protein CVT25_012829 [Psilocybe cyanescens]
MEDEISGMRLTKYVHIYRAEDGTRALTLNIDQVSNSKSQARGVNQVGHVIASGLHDGIIITSRRPSSFDRIFRDFDGSHIRLLSASNPLRERDSEEGLLELGGHRLGSQKTNEFISAYSHHHHHHS